MADIVLTTLNAKYPHCSFGLRYLLANMGHLSCHTSMLEFTINQHTVEVVDTIFEQQPKIVGLGIYIWNVEQSTRLVAQMKQVRPDLIVVLGGPEVSAETDTLELVHLADYVIKGEADLTFPRICQELLTESRLTEHIIQATLPDLHDLKLPYELYTQSDIEHRVIYVEASRGCPFTCEFCLSALDIPVRQVPLEPFLHAMQSLLDRGANQFKFVDRTFNLNPRVSRAILEFFLKQYRPGLFLHFEMVPDRLPGPLRELILQFPPGALQFEIGVQSFNEHVADLISRKQNNSKLEENLRFLREQTGVHIHADLIVGLPGESIESFASGFDRLVSLNPQEIQIGMLKRLKGTPIVRHDRQWQMVYSPHAPYEILQNVLIDFATMNRLRRFARFWDLLANSGNFVETLPWIWRGTPPFQGFSRFSDWLFDKERRIHGISLLRLTEHVFNYLIERQGAQPDQAATAVWRDYHRNGRHDKPQFLRPFALETPQRQPTTAKLSPPRQSRHAAVDT